MDSLRYKARNASPVQEAGFKKQRLITGIGFLSGCEDAGHYIGIVEID